MLSTKALSATALLINVASGMSWVSTSPPGQLGVLDGETRARVQKMLGLKPGFRASLQEAIDSGDVTRAVPHFNTDVYRVKTIPGAIQSFMRPFSPFLRSSCSKVDAIAGRT